MFFCILNDKKKICLIDVYDKRTKTYYTLCGKAFSKNSQNLISLDHIIKFNCNNCVMSYIEIFGEIDEMFSRNYSQQNLIIQQQSHKFYNKGKKYLRKIRL